MRPKNKKHKHFSRTDNKKYQEQNHKKEKTNNNHSLLLFLSHSRPLYSSHTTHHPTHNTQQKALPTRGDLQNNTRAALDTQQHATKQNKPEHKHTCYSAKPFTTNKAERPQKILVSSTPKTTHMKCVRYLSSPANKKLATTRCLTRHPTRRQNK